MMSRQITTRVVYGKHAVSKYHPRVDQITLPFDILGCIMDQCDLITKTTLARTCHQLCRLLRDRIMRTNVYLKWPNVVGHKLRDLKQATKLRMSISLNIHNMYIDIDNDPYAELIPPKCEHCMMDIYKNWREYISARKVWASLNATTYTLYIGACARVIRTFMCLRCTRLMVSGDHDIATARLRICNDLVNYNTFYTALTRYYLTNADDDKDNLFLILSQHFNYVFQRTFTRKQEILRWEGIVNRDLAIYLTYNSFPFHALTMQLLHDIVRNISARDIKMMKCVCKLQKIIFTNLELILKIKP